MDEPKRILCYGDFNTWEFISGKPFHRYNRKERLTTIIQHRLGDLYEIIVEDLNGRTIISDDPRPNMVGRNGSVYLIPCIDSQDPLDLVIVMLGTTELKEMFNNSAEHVAELLEEHIIKAIINHKSQFRSTTPKVLTISPPLVEETTDFARGLFKGAREKSEKLGELYEDIAKRNNCYFLNARNAEIGVDGIHLTQEGHKQMSDRIYYKLNTIQF